VIHEKKIFEDLSKFSLFCPKRGQPLYLNKSESPIPQACSLPSLVEIGLVVLEKKSFKGKSCRTDVGRTLHHPISSAGLWPGELIIYSSYETKFISSHTGTTLNFRRSRRTLSNVHDLHGWRRYVLQWTFTFSVMDSDVSQRSASDKH